MSLGREGGVQRLLFPPARVEAAVESAPPPAREFFEWLLLLRRAQLTTGIFSDLH